MQYLVRNCFSLRRFANLVISLESDVYSRIEEQLDRFMHEQLDNLSLKTLSTMDGQVSLHYQFRRKPDFSRTEFVKNLNQMTHPAQAQIFLGGSALAQRNEGIHQSITSGVSLSCTPEATQVGSEASGKGSRPSLPRLALIDRSRTTWPWPWSKSQ